MVVNIALLPSWSGFNAKLSTNKSNSKSDYTSIDMTFIYQTKNYHCMLSITI